MSMTLTEAAKLYAADPVRAAIIELYAAGSDILAALPFNSISGSALAYNREESLPGIGFRGVNGGYDESSGVINPISESLTIAGGDLDVDTFIIKTQGMGVRTTHEVMKMKALALAWTRTFIKGNSAVDPLLFDGLQVRVAGDQKVAAGATANGDALSLAKLDEAIDNVVEPTHIIMSKAMRRKLSVAARTGAVGGDLQWQKVDFGKQVAFYNGIPILETDKDNVNVDILGFNEVCPGGGTLTGTSIYVISLGDGKVSGIQNGDPTAEDIGRLQTKQAYRTTVEWLSTITIYHPRAVVRIWGISDAPITN